MRFYLFMLLICKWSVNKLMGTLHTESPYVSYVIYKWHVTCINIIFLWKIVRPILHDRFKTLLLWQTLISLSHDRYKNNVPMTIIDPFCEHYWGCFLMTGPFSHNNYIEILSSTVSSYREWCDSFRQSWPIATLTLGSLLHTC